MTLALLWMCAALATGVFVAMLYSVATFRPATDDPTPRRRRAIEMMWSLVPIIIFAVAAAPTFLSLGATAAD